MDGAGPGHEEFQGVVEGGDAAEADDRDVHGGGDLVDHADGDRLDGGTGEPPGAVAEDGAAAAAMRRRWCPKPVRRWLVTAACARMRAGRGKSCGTGVRARRRRRRPGVGGGWRSQQPVGMAGAVAAV